MQDAVAKARRCDIARERGLSAWRGDRQHPRRPLVGPSRRGAPLRTLGFVALLLAFEALGAATRAWALCPNCLAQQRGWDARSGVLAAFVVFPLLVAYGAWRLIARSLRPPRSR